MILESDSVIDVKSNISAVEDIQNHKMECHEINDDSNKILCNLNKNVGDNTDVKDEKICDKKEEDSTDAKDEIICDVDNDLANRPLSVENNKADMNNTDLSDLHSDKNNLDLHIDDSNMKSLGESIVEKRINNKPDEIVEEDYLEDDIISIRVDSIHEVSETKNNIEQDITENDEALLLEENLLNENGLASEKDTIDLSEDQDICNLPCEKQTDTEIEKETEVIEIKEIKDITDNCDKEIKILTKEETKEFKEELTTILSVHETEVQYQKHSEPIMFKDKTKVSISQCEKEAEKEVQEKMDEEYSVVTELSCGKTPTHEETQITKINEEINQCNDPSTTEKPAQEEMEVEDLMSENKLADSPPTKEIKTELQEKIEVADETKHANTQCKEETEIHEKMEIVETTEKIKIIIPVEETKPSVISCENDTEAEIMEVDDCEEVTEQVAAAEDANSCMREKKSESSIDTQDVEIIEKESQCGSQSKEALESVKPDQIEETDALISNECSVPCDNKSDSVGILKQSNNNLQEKDQAAAVNSNDMNSSIEEIQITNKSEHETDTVNKLICTKIQSEDKSTIDKEDNTRETSATTKIVSGQCDTKIDATAKIETTDKSIITTPPHENESTNSETQIEISDADNLNSPAVKEIDIMNSKQDVIETNDNLELINVDAEDEVEPTSKNNKVTTDVTDLSSNNSDCVENFVPIEPLSSKDTLIACKSSYTLDIFSDEEELTGTDSPKVEAPQIEQEKAKQCFNIDDDDDIMLIDEDTNKPTEKTDIDNKNEPPKTPTTEKTNTEIDENLVKENSNVLNKSDQQDISAPVIDIKDATQKIDINEKTNENTIEKPKELGSLLPENFLNTAKTKLSDMTRDDLEEFCILKIVESIVDRTSLSDIKNKLKEMSQGLEDYRKKALMLTKQNRDLQVVLKSVQEEQKKVNRDTPITPLKITRSVGVQVYMEKAMPRKKIPQQNVNNKNSNTPQNKNLNPNQGRVTAPTKAANQNIPVPRLVPAVCNSTLKTPSTIPQINTPNKNTNTPNGIRNPSPSLKAEKRPHNKIASNETVDLTDDEPPTKLPTGAKSSPAPPVRLVPSQNLMAPQRHAFPQGMNSPRKVYIPISGPPSQAIRPGQTIMLKSVPAPGIRARGPAPPRMESMRLHRILSRHPAPLPFATKQYQPPNWKSLPPAPDLKLSKVENGIVISWKIEDVPEDTYEEIASYQLFAYQETSLPASTSLWKKIGDVKALPLPMACTLTQFMAGFKYYFAVRAVDIRSRLGPFSLPGSILLLNKNILD